MLSRDYSATCTGFGSVGVTVAAVTIVVLAGGGGRRGPLDRCSLDALETMHKCPAAALANLAERYRNASWWHDDARCATRRLERTLLVLGDSVDTQLFHSLEHAVGQSNPATRGPRRVLRADTGSAAARGRELETLSVVRDDRGGGALIYCRDDGLRSALSANVSSLDIPYRFRPCAAWRARGRLHGREVEFATVGLGRWYGGDTSTWKPHGRYERTRDEAGRARLLAAYERKARVLVARLRAAGIAPIWTTLAACNMVADDARRALNRIGTRVARDLGVPLVPLGEWTEALVQDNAALVGLPRAGAFREVGPRRMLAGACGEAPAANASCAQPLLMVDGAHWCTPVTLPWGELVLQTIDDCLDDAACAANVSAAWSNRAPRTDEDECACLKRKAAQCVRFTPGCTKSQQREVDRELAKSLARGDLKDDVDDRA